MLGGGHALEVGPQRELGTLTEDPLHSALFLALERIVPERGRQLVQQLHRGEVIVFGKLRTAGIKGSQVILCAGHCQCRIPAGGVPNHRHMSHVD